MTDNTLLDIAEGRNRRETNWKNKEVTWDSLVDRISKTHRTAETYQVYMSSPKDRQAEIKDIGGFVGGYMNSGRRKSGSIIHRQVLTLDLDYAKASQWKMFAILYDNAGLMYSTHSHSKAAPRYRLIMPLTRPVTTAEYQAIGRRVAGNLGIDHFDNTGFQPERLMYWPSTSIDGVYEFYSQEGPWLDADEVLSSYRDWTNTYEWPIGERYTVQLLEGMKKQGHPPDKPGAIGAFCSTYTLTEAIDKFLTDQYVPCDVPDRYTYIGGSTAAGLVVYDDLYAYSHHGTDPASGKLCNAYDLVRLHLYGHLDDAASADTPLNRLPSSSAMTEFAVKDKEVRKLIVDSSITRAQASDDFADFIIPEVAAEVAADRTEEGKDADEWKGNLDVGKKGEIHSTINNVMLILENDPYLRGRIAFNEFECREVALKSLPWRKINKFPAYLNDSDDAGIRYYLEKTYGIASAGKIDDGLKLAMLKNAFHPVKDFLEQCLWDGIPRVDTLLVDYLGAENNDYTRAVTRKALVAAIARIYEPGVKFDHVLTLIGLEGIGKSTIWRKLGMAWFTDSFTTVLGKEAFEQIQGVWLVEIPELSGLKKADAEAVKHFIAKQNDRYRVAYGRRVDDYPRQCVFFGTTNKHDFLVSENGNRRFWPVTTLIQEPTKLIQSITPYVAGLIWAEAIELYKAGETLYLERDMELNARKIQSEHTEQDDRAGAIEAFVNMKVPESWDTLATNERINWLSIENIKVKEPATQYRLMISAAEIWVELFRGSAKDMNAYNTKFIHTVLGKLPGFTLAKSKLTFHNYGRQRAYIRSEVTEAIRTAN